MAGPIVALSVDGAPSYSWLVRRCVASSRRTGTRLPVVVLASRDAALDTGDLAGVEVVRVEPGRGTTPFLEKWRRLSSLDAERVVYLDADTICLEPLERLLDRYRAADVYAREEAGTQRGAVPGGFPAQVDWGELDRQRRAAVRRPPVLNTGVLVLNNGVCRRLEPVLERLREFHDGWATGAVAYPCTNEHIMEELALSSALGRSRAPTVGLLSPADAPYYAELAPGEPARGIVLHVWTGLYSAYLREHEDAAAATEYDRLRRRDELRRIRRRASARRTATAAGPA